MKKQQPLPSGLQSALVTALEFIRVVVTEMPRTRERVLTAMDLSDEGFDEEIDTLENLLASFTIFLDKPFVVGDSVKIGNIVGTVERVGFRSTRIRTLEKSLVSMPNKKMVDDVLDNLTNRNIRRVKFNIGLQLDNKKENIDKFIAQIKSVVEKHDLTGPDFYIYFQGFDESNYSIFMLYFINTTEEKNYIKAREEINLEILALAEKNEIKFEVYVK